MKRLKTFNNFCRTHISYSFYLFIFLFFFSALNADAARLDLLPTLNSVKVGDIFKVRIVLSSPSESANAVSGNISFSNNLLDLTSISKANSVISLWPVDPTYSNSTGRVSFEGVILTNGYTGSNATVLTLIFKAKSVGSANINFIQGSVLANDGAGTPLVTSLGDSQINISATVINNPVKSPNNTNNTGSVKNTPTTLQIEEIKKKDELDLRSRFLITSLNKKTNIPYKIEVDDTPYVWDDATDHVFETAPLSRGIHTIRVYMETIEGQSISKSISFSNTGIHTPIFTDFSNNMIENEYIVIKGLADPLAFVKIDSDFVSSNYDTKHDSMTVKADEKGMFTYVSTDRSVLGVYSFVATAQTEDGIESDKTVPIKIAIKSGSTSLFKKIASTLAVIIPIFAMLVLFILFVIYSWYKIRSYKEILRKRLLQTKTLVDQEFKILEKDLGKESQIVEKAKASEPLTDDDLGFVKQFKKDLNTAQSEINDDLNNSSK